MNAEIDYIKKTIFKYLERFETDNVAEVENVMSPADRVSLVYLLYDNPEVAVECLTWRSKCSIVTEWCEDHSKKNLREWKLRIVESLALMQNFKCLKHLGYNKRDLGEVSKILDRAERSEEFDIRKILYSTFDCLTVNEIIKVIDLFDGNKSCYGRPDLYKPEHVEIYLLQWQIEGKISLNPKGLNNLLQVLRKLNLRAAVDTLVRRLEQLPEHRDNSENIKEAIGTDSPTLPEVDIPRDYYPIIDPEHVGLCIVVNLENYPKESKHKPRRGSQCDVQRLQATMSRLKIETFVLCDLKHSDIFPSIESIVRFNFDPKIYSVLFVVVMGHGTKDVIVGIDGKSVETDMIRDTLSKERCPNLGNKPKIIIFQCCRGDFHCDTNKLEADSPEDDRGHPRCLIKPSMEDYIICWSTIPGFKSYRSPDEGSLYIQTLCKCLDESYRDDHIYNILHRVHREFSNQKFLFSMKVVSIMPEFSSGLNRNLYLVQKRPS